MLKSFEQDYANYGLNKSDFWYKCCRRIFIARTVRSAFDTDAGPDNIYIYVIIPVNPNNL